MSGIRQFTQELKPAKLKQELYTALADALYATVVGEGLMNRGLRARFRQLGLLAGSCAAIFAFVYGLRGADQPASPAPVFQQYCVGCHNNKLATAGINLEKLIASPSIAENYQVWERVSGRSNSIHDVTPKS